MIARVTGADGRAPGSGEVETDFPAQAKFAFLPDQAASHGIRAARTGVQGHLIRPGRRFRLIQPEMGVARSDPIVGVRPLAELPNRPDVGENRLGVSRSMSINLGLGGVRRRRRRNRLHVEILHGQLRSVHPAADRVRPHRAVGPARLP